MAIEKKNVVGQEGIAQLWKRTKAEISNVKTEIEGQLEDKKVQQDKDVATVDALPVIVAKSNPASGTTTDTVKYLPKVTVSPVSGAISAGALDVTGNITAAGTIDGTLGTKAVNQVTGLINSNPSPDTKVKQTVTSTGAEREILVKGVTTSGTAGEAYYVSGVKVNPTNGTLSATTVTATTLNGTLGTTGVEQVKTLISGNTTDEKVKQVAASKNEDVPVLLKGAASDATPSQVLYAGVTINPATNTLTATNIKGDFSGTLSGEALEKIEELVGTGVSSLFHLQGTKASATEVKAITTAKKGDVWLVTSDKSEWVCIKDITAADASAWEELGRVHVSVTIPNPAFTGTKVATIAVDGVTYDIKLPTISSGTSINVSSDANGNLTVNHKQNITTGKTITPSLTGHTIKVPNFTVNGEGHVTTSGTTDLTLPNDNTDTKVTQSATTENTALPIILANSASGGTAGVKYDADLKYNPSTNSMTIGSNQVITENDITVIDADTMDAWINAADAQS